MTKALLGGAGTGANPTDRGKKGTKKSLLTDSKGIPLSVTVDEANRHDKKLVKETLDAIILERPSPDDVIQSICMGKGYYFPDIRELPKEHGYTAHLKTDPEDSL
jgi:putative transposase